jgi:hypothetical protein
VQTAHDQEIMCSNPGTVSWMDVSDNASYHIKEKLKKKTIYLYHFALLFIENETFLLLLSSIKNR